MSGISIGTPAASDSSAASAPGGVERAAGTQPCINVQNLELTFFTGNGQTTALQDINLSIGEGEFVALLGPTGCGKSSMLRVVSDLLKPTAGTVTIRGKPPSVARQANDFGFVFQEPALLPWRTALDNVRLPLEVVGFPADQRQSRCAELLESVNLLKFKDAYPHELSGGMKQRIAIIRALSWRPSILLMDEPFSALDEITKGQLQEDLLELWESERKTVLFVTHNISEAVYLADRVVVLSSHPGRIRRIIPVELPRPRAENIRETMEFLRHVREAREELTV